MQVREVMTEHAECAKPNTSLREAAMMMKDLDVGVLPVCEEDRLIGMVTDRDITIRAVAEGHDPSTHRVDEAMTRSMFWCFEDQEVEEVVAIMKEKQIRRVPVLDRGKRLVGIVSIGDLAVQTGDGRTVGETLGEISEPSVPRR